MLPEDPAILLSYINTQLRDRYSSLEALCAELDADRQAVEEKLKAIDYEYDSAQNRFV